MKKPSNTQKVTDPALAAVLDAFACDGRVTRGGRFGAVSLRVNDKVFVMLVKGRLVVKLSAARVAELVADGAAEPFTSGGRQMKEWAALTDDGRWPDAAREAYRFVGG